MLLLNNQVLPANADKNAEMYPYVNEYKEKIKLLRKEYPKGEIMLSRIGYPQMNPTGLSEDIPPVYIPMENNDSNGALWSYCEGRPVIQPTGLRELAKEDRSRAFGEMILLDLNKKEDYAFFIMYKSNIVGNLYKIFNPEGDRLKALRVKNERDDVGYAISRGMDESKLRAVAAAWDINGAYDKDILIVGDDLERKVFAMDEIKKKQPMNLQLKGINEFLLEIKNDDYMMPKALVKKSLDYKNATYKDRLFSLGDIEICTVPFNKKDDYIDWIAGFLRHPDNKEKWDQFLFEMVDNEFIEKLDKYGTRWLASQMNIPLNQQEADLKVALLAKFQAK